LAGDEVVASMLLTAISIGMGLGSVLCNKLSQGVIHLGLVVTSAFGLGIFGCDLYFNGITHQLPAGQYLSFTEFIAVPANWRALFDLMGIGVFGGMYIVPLYTLMQKHAPKVYASQIVASNNIWNALFMVSAALVAMLLFALKLTILQIFLVVASVNFFIALYLLIKGPQHFYLIMFNVLFRAIYRIKVKGREYLPDSGPVLVVANHVSFIDPLLLCAALDRPPRFMMDKSYYDWKILRWFFTTSRSIPVTPKKIDPQLMEWALQQVVDGLNRGEMIAIFPEGFITKDGEMIDFKDGLERIAQKVPELKVVPVAIKGMWGSWFSRYSGRALKGRAPKRFWAKLEIEIGQTHQGPAIQAQALQKTVRDLRGNFL
jgi:1-acyl-sn-glycerol-3-phosphate acyltransferase